MIKGVNGSNGIAINGGYASWPQFYNNASTSGNTLIGQLRYNGSSQNLEVYDGNSWQTIGGGSATVNLTSNAIAILKWAERKMNEEYELQALAATNPTIKDLVDQMNNSVLDYQRKIAMVKTLIKEEEKIVTS